MKQTITTVTAIATLLIAAPAYAQIGAGLTGNTSVESTVNSAVNTRADMNAQVDANADVNTNVSADTTANADVSADNMIEATIDGAVDLVSDVEVNANTGAEVRVESNTSASNNSDNMNKSSARIMINGTIVTPAMNTNVTVSSDVNDEEDLAVFARVMAEEDVQIKSVAASDNQVTVKYAEEVKLFGLFKVNMKRTADVMFNTDSSTTVSVSKPWWSFMASGSAAANADLESDIAAQMATSSYASVTADARAKAEAMASVTAAFKASLATDYNSSRSNKSF